MWPAMATQCRRCATWVDANVIRVQGLLFSASQDCCLIANISSAAANVAGTSAFTDHVGIGSNWFPRAHAVAGQTNSTTPKHATSAYHMYAAKTPQLCYLAKTNNTLAAHATGRMQTTTTKVPLDTCSCHSACAALLNSKCVHIAYGALNLAQQQAMRRHAMYICHACVHV